MLLTRFSAVLSPDGRPASDEWLFYRLGFFYDACYASVTRQRGADFDWLVLLDDRCPDDFRDQVEQLADGAFTPVWTHEPFRRDAFATHVARVTARPSPAAYLITTRIDSDDAMATDFMAAVQGQFACQKRLFVNFPRGVQIDRTGAVYRSDTLSSPFLSLIEQRTDGPPDTVYVAKHARARAHGPIREVKAPAMWAQVVHGVNVSNIVNGTRVPPRVVADRFDIDLGYDATIAGRRLVAGQARQLGRLGRLWAAHPGELTKWAEARAWSLRGTHERPADDGATLTDRIQDLERSASRSWQESRTRAGLRAAALDSRARRWRLRSRLNAAAAPDLRVVAGDLDRVLAGDRVVVIAEYAAHAVRDSALAAARAWSEAGLAVLVVAARDPWRRLPPPQDLPPDVAVVRRPNVGYDFGSWSAALRARPALAVKDLVVLMNDSLVGPLGAVDDLLARIETSDADVWGATRGLRPSPHLQSYLLAFRSGVLAREPLRGFFAGIEPQASKQAVIDIYELGLGRLLDEHRLRTAVGWTNEELDLPAHVNATFQGWRALLDAGFPFVKRSLLELPHLKDQRAVVVDVLTKRYGWHPPG